MCTCCGTPFVSQTGVDHLCSQCEQVPKPYRVARAVGQYEGALRSLIHTYKYQGQVHLALPLGRMLWGTFIEHWLLSEIDGIIPVPLHPKRSRMRGFNQAALLTRHWPEYFQVLGHIQNGPWIDTDLLVRVRATPTQTGLDRQQRHDNLKQAFLTADQSRVRDSRLLIVDDVLTTGATIEACAHTLLDAGAAAVHVLTLARVV